MNTYSDILERLNGKRQQVGDKKMAHLNFAIGDCELGETCTYTITGIITGLSMNSTELEIIDLKENQGKDDREEEMMKMKIVPSPS